MVNQPQYLTPEGLENLEKKLEHLKQVRRQEVAARLHQARQEGGDLSENAEFEDAKTEQAFIEGEIARLELIVSSAEIIEATGQRDEVRIGSVVTVAEKGTRDTEVYHLVGSAEANPREGKISIESPLGKSLMGAKVKDKVVVAAPDGDITFIIKSID